MTRFYTFAAAGALAACIGATAWSQTAQSGGAGGAGAAGASGGAGVSGSAGATGAAGQGAAAGQGQGGAAGQAAAAARAGGQVQNPNNVPGQQQFISPPAGNNDFDFNDPLRRPFFTDPGARQQLNMNDQQFNQLNQARQQVLTQFDQAVNQINANPNLTPPQRAQQMQRLQARFNQQFGRTVDSTFTDPRLRQRFNQLDWQFRPFAAFNDATVNQQLQLTPQQQRQMRQLGVRWRQQMQRLRRAGSNAATDPALANEQFAAMQAQFQQQIQQVMTPQQQQAWTQMTGEQFNFPRTAFFPQDNDIRVAEQPRFPQGVDDGNVGVTQGTPAKTQQNNRAGSQNNSANGTQTDSNAGVRDGNVGVTQGTPAKGPR